MSRAGYVIRVAGGEVPPAGLEDFEGVLVGQSLITTLFAEVDSVALNGLIIALRDIGLELVDVQREWEADTPLVEDQSPRDLLTSCAKLLSLVPTREVVEMGRPEQQHTVAAQLPEGVTVLGEPGVAGAVERGPG